MFSEAAAPAEEAKPEEKKAETKNDTVTDKKAKRASIFGNIFSKSGKEDKEKEAAPAKNAETPAVSSTAPQLGDPVDPATSEPIKAETVTSPESGEQAKDGEQTAASPSTSKGGFLNFIKKDNKGEVCL